MKGEAMNEQEIHALAKRQGETIERQSKELQEYYRVEDVIIAAGLISKDKIAQAHELVRSFPT